MCNASPALSSEQRQSPLGFQSTAELSAVEILSFAAASAHATRTTGNLPNASQACSLFAVWFLFGVCLRDPGTPRNHAIGAQEKSPRLSVRVVVVRVVIDLRSGMRSLLSRRRRRGSHRSRTSAHLGYNRSNPAARWLSLRLPDGA